MGNQLTSTFNISEKDVVMGGPSNVLKIYKATKKSSKNKVSLFTIKKKEVRSDSKILSEAIFEGIRKEVKTLTKLRHPSILHIMEPLGEDSGHIWFGTEPIEGSLKYLLETPSKHHLIPSEIELKAQLLELIGTVVFLHNNAHLLHLAISPENIYLTADGKFKLAGFFFSQSTSSSSFHNIDYTLMSKSVSFVPHFGFTAPELIKENTVSTSSDTFSIGALLYTLLQVVKGGKASYFLDVKDGCTKQMCLEQIRNLNNEYTHTKLSSFNSGAIDLLQKLLNRNPEERLKLHIAYTHSWLNDPKIKTLDYLEHLNEKEHQHKLQYLEGLMKVIDEFDNKVIERRILPTLASYLPMAKISAYILPPIITILGKEGLCSKSIFYSSVWPQLQYICKCSEVSANILYLIIDHPEVWLKFLNIQDFQSTLVVLYQKAINCGVTKIQEASLKSLEKFAKKIEYATLKTGFLPRIVKLVQSTNVNALRIKCMESIASFSSFLDKATVKNTILPTLEKLSKTNTDGRLHLAMIRTIESFLKLFSYEELATTVIPLLLLISVGGQFTKRQFSDVMELIRTLVDKVDTTRSKELTDIEESAMDQPKPKEIKIEQSKDKDVFDFLNQISSESKKGGEKKVEEKKEEWDMVFDISRDSIPMLKKAEYPSERKSMISDPFKSIAAPKYSVGAIENKDKQKLKLPEWSQGHTSNEDSFGGLEAKALTSQYKEDNPFVSSNNKPQPISDADFDDFFNSYK